MPTDLPEVLIADRGLPSQIVDETVAWCAGCVRLPRPARNAIEMGTAERVP